MTVWKDNIMKKELEKLLLQHEGFLVEGILNKNKLSELARKYDEKLLNILMKEENVNVNLNMSKKFKIKMYILFICLLEKIFKSIRISSYFSYMWMV